MNRRETIQALLISAGGLITLPSWAQGWKATSLSISPSVFTTAEEELFTSIADTIIPAGNSIGALSVGVDKFLQKLFNDCYTPEVQQNIKVHFQKLDTSAKQLHGKSFAACGQKDREKLLTAFSTSDNKDDNDFFNLMKGETIRGFNTSKEVMTTYYKYKTVPGHYYGCVDVNQ